MAVSGVSLSQLGPEMGGEANDDVITWRGDLSPRAKNCMVGPQYSVRWETKRKLPFRELGECQSDPKTRKTGERKNLNEERTDVFVAAVS